MKQMRLRAVITGVFTGVTSELLRIVRCSLLSISPYAVFAGSSLIGPLAGAYGGVSAALSSNLVRLIAILLSRGTLSPLLSLSVYQIPTFCAALYWAWIGRPSQGGRSTVLSRAAVALIPLLCMVAFILDPVGGKAVPYAMIWWLPVLSALIPHNYRFIHALASTYTAHAVGSVVWLTTHSLTAEQWLGLIPVACIERCFMAAGMIVCLEIVDRAGVWISQSRKAKQEILYTHVTQ